MPILQMRKFHSVILWLLSFGSIHTQESGPLALIISYPSTEPGTVTISWKSFTQNKYELSIYSFNTNSKVKEIFVSSDITKASINGLDISTRYYAVIIQRSTLSPFKIQPIVSDPSRSKVFCAVRGRLSGSCPLIAKDVSHSSNFAQSLTLTIPKEMHDECVAEWYIQYARLEQPHVTTTAYFNNLGSVTISITYGVIYRVLLHVKLIGGHSVELCTRKYILNRDLELKLQWLCFELVHLSWKIDQRGATTNWIYEVRCSSEGDIRAASLTQAASVNITNISIGESYQCSVQANIPGTDVLSNPSQITFTSGLKHVEDIKVRYYSSGYAAITFVDSASKYTGSPDHLLYKIDCRSLNSNDPLISSNGKESPIIIRNLSGNKFYNCSMYGIDNCLKTSHQISFDITTYDRRFHFKWLCLNIFRFSWNISTNEKGNHWSYKVTCNGEDGKLFEHSTHTNWIDTNDIIINTTYNCTFQARPSGTEFISYTTQLSFITGYTQVENIKLETNDSGYAWISFTELTSINDSVTLDNLLYQIDCHSLNNDSENQLISTDRKRLQLILRDLPQSTFYICSLYQIDECQNRRHVKNINISTNEESRPKMKSNGFITIWVAVFFLVIAFATMFVVLHKCKSRSERRLHAIESENVVHRKLSIFDDGKMSRTLIESSIGGSVVEALVREYSEFGQNSGTKILNDKKILRESQVILTPNQPDIAKAEKHNYECAAIKKTPKVKEGDMDGLVKIKARRKRQINI